MASQAEVDLVISTAGALPELERDLTRIVGQAEDGAPTIGLDAAVNTSESLADMQRQLTQVVRAAQNGAPDIDLDATLDQLSSVRRLQRDLDRVINRARAGNTDEVELTTVVNTVRSLRTLRTSVNSIVRRVDPDPIEVPVDVDRTSVRSATSRLAEFGRSVGSAALSLGRFGAAAGSVGVGIGALLPVLAATSAALQQIAPAAGVAVTGMASLALAATTVKLAMVGVGEAIETAFDPEAKPEDLEKALKRLAPEARKFVTELRSMRSQLRRVQQEVQNRFFKDFDDTLRTLSRTTLPVVRRSLNDTADSLNEMARGAANAANDLAADGTLGIALDGAAKGLENLRRIPAQIVTGLGQIAAAAAPAFDKLTRRIDTAATKIADRINKAFETGALEDRIDQALSSIGQLFDSFGNILSGIGNIFSGLTENGRGFFDVLEELTQAFEDLTASKEFQLILSELAKTADTLVANLLPPLREAFKQLAPVIAELAPVVREFIDEIGPELVPILKELGPILVDIAKIMREQLPLAIDLTKGALSVLRVALEFLGFIIEDVVLPISRKFRQLYENDLVRGIRAFVNALGVATLDVIRKLPQIGQAFSDVFSRISRILGDFSAYLRRNVVGAFAGFIADVASRIRALPGIIAQAFASLGRILYSNGLNAILGFISGFSSGIGRLLSIARGVADRITDTIRSALNIASPSKVMAGIGEDTMEGLVVGMKRMIPEIEDTVNGIAGTISPSFALPGGETLGLSPLSIGGPSVNVFIGNEQLTGRIDARIDANNRARDRVISKGVRR